MNQNKIGIYAIFDRAANAFMQPNFMATDGAAIRAFSDTVNRKSTEERPNVIRMHASDYEFYKLGTYDDQTGVITSEVKCLITALNCLEKEDK